MPPNGPVAGAGWDIQSASGRPVNIPFGIRGGEARAQLAFAARYLTRRTAAPRIQPWNEDSSPAPSTAC
ncbi:hypothetical protein GCM10010282_19100 [Streptomyces roseolus]|nr:hypothetical protein GCM10010282_19100 [Streptomyces roseolus]